MHPRSLPVAGLCFVLLVASASSVTTRAQAGPVRSADAVQWLLSQQEENGGFGEVPGRVKGQLGITAVVVRALAGVTPDLKKEVAPKLDAAVAFMLSCQQKDGSFAQGPGLKTYYTAVCVQALASVDRKKHAAPIAKGAAWLKDAQFGAKDGITSDDVRFGGFGYDSAGKKRLGWRRLGADLSNTHMALSALAAARTDAEDAAFVRARTFLARCQNHPEVNDGRGMRPRSDGGFVYSPGSGDEGRVAPPSYAGMTYAGLHCLAIVGRGPKDPTYRAALAWAAKHYTLNENAGVNDGDGGHGPQAGLYYFYLSFSEGLAKRGSKSLETPAGPRAWAEDLMAALGKRQRKDGSFANQDRTWWENNPVLATAFALSAMNRARPFLSKG